MTKMTGKQLRMARASMKYRIDDLSKKTGVHWAKIQLLERSEVELEHDNKIEKIIKFFEENNIIFEDGDKDFLPFIKIKR